MLICESCKSHNATLHIQKLSDIAQAAELVCVHCAYAKVKVEPVGMYHISYIKGVEAQ